MRSIEIALLVRSNRFELEPYFTEPLREPSFRRSKSSIPVRCPPVRPVEPWLPPTLGRPELSPRFNGLSLRTGGISLRCGMSSRLGGSSRRGGSCFDGKSRRGGFWRSGMPRGGSSRFGGSCFGGKSRRGGFWRSGMPRGGSSRFGGSCRRGGSCRGGSCLGGASRLGGSCRGGSCRAGGFCRGGSWRGGFCFCPSCEPPLPLPRLSGSWNPSAVGITMAKHAAIATRGNNVLRCFIFFCILRRTLRQIVTG
jgi:hypothetical protein